MTDDYGQSETLSRTDRYGGNAAVTGYFKGQLTIKMLDPAKSDLGYLPGDRYGNRWIDLGGGNQSLYFNTANNRITNAGYVYDAAGNLTNDGVQPFAFDGENKIKTVNGEIDVYRYDGDGNRVRKNFTNGEKVRMVYSGGQLIAEYDLSNSSLKRNTFT